MQNGATQHPLSLWKASFSELYSRHLCRHGEFGINVLHLIAVYGIYLSIYSLVGRVVMILLPDSDLLTQSIALTVASLPYVILMLKNLPWYVLLIVLLSVASLIPAGAALSSVPWWLHLILIPAWHRLQLWSHKVYRREEDMFQFAQKYPKGATLFVVLSVYELPILLNFFLSREQGETPKEPADSVTPLTV